MGFPERIAQRWAMGLSHLVRDGCKLTLCGRTVKPEMDRAYLGRTDCPPNIADTFKCRPCWTLQAVATHEVHARASTVELPRTGTRVRAVVDTLHRWTTSSLGHYATWNQLAFAYIEARSPRSNIRYVGMALSRITKKYADRIDKGRYVLKRAYIDLYLVGSSEPQPPERKVPRACKQANCPFCS